MKVLNLRCSSAHSFEGWFASEEDFQTQLANGLLECPLCADTGIHKMPSAPRLNLGGHADLDPSGHPGQNAQTTGDAERAHSPLVATSAPHDAPAVGQPDLPVSAAAGPSPELQARFLRALRHVVANTEDVGARFADEARRIHYGDAEVRSIRGQTSPREALELLEEGIEVMPLPMPAALKETLQ